MIRKTVHYSGHVQGVGFRFTARSIARSFQVTGYVRNLSDRSVELAAEGDPVEVGKFLMAVADRMEHNIHQAQVHESPWTGEFTGFDIRH